MADRLARALVVAAARRWPDDLAAVMRDEWLAELAAAGGWRRRLTFAVSLAVSPAVDEPSWPDRARSLGRASAVAAGVTLGAAVAANLARGAALFAPVLLVVAAIALGLAGRRIRVPVPLVGAAVFAFLLAGNPVPIMPFMGAADIAPAVAVWAVGVAAVTRWSRRLSAAGRARRAAGFAVAGGLLTLELATIAGSAHAASVLGVPAGSSPAWFPLALLPGDTVAFGPYFPDGAAAFGSLQSSGPAFHASDILLANAAVMTGPLLLCTAFVMASAFPGPAVARRAPGVRARTAPGRCAPWIVTTARHATSHLRPGTTAITTRARRILTIGPRAGSRVRGWASAVTGDARRIVVGVGAAVAGLVVAPLLAVAPADAEAALPRMLDNSTAFGFGFVEHPVGLGLVALVVAGLAVQAADARDAAG